MQHAILDRANNCTDKVITVIFPKCRGLDHNEVMRCACYKELTQPAVALTDGPLQNHWSSVCCQNNLVGRFQAYRETDNMKICSPRFPGSLASLIRVCKIELQSSLQPSSVWKYWVFPIIERNRAASNSFFVNLGRCACDVRETDSSCCYELRHSITSRKVRIHNVLLPRKTLSLTRDQPCCTATGLFTSSPTVTVRRTINLHPSLTSWTTSMRLQHFPAINTTHLCRGAAGSHLLESQATARPLLSACQNTSLAGKQSTSLQLR